MKEYSLSIPKRLDNKTQEIMEYLLVKHYEDDVLSAGACALLLQVEKYYFQSKIEPKYENL